MIVLSHNGRDAVSVMRIMYVGLQGYHYQVLCKEDVWEHNNKLVYCITDISPNNLYKFSSAALSSIDVATATPHSSALHMKQSFGVNVSETYFSVY